MLPWIGWIVLAYLLGSVPFGVVIGRARGVDIRTKGSRNIGATNVGRVLGKRFGLLCFALDLAKGAVPVLASGWERGVLGLAPEPGGIEPSQMWMWLLVAAATITGHMASVFIRFAGGKGVATSFGAMLAMWPLLTLPAIAAFAVWFVTLKATRYVSLASIAAAVSLPLWYLVRVFPREGDVVAGLVHASPPLVVTIALGAVVIWRHRGNIARLRRGEEPRSDAPLR